MSSFSIPFKSPSSPFCILANSPNLPLQRLDVLNINAVIFRKQQTGLLWNLVFFLSNVYWLFKKEKNSALKCTGNLLLFIVILFCNLACRCVEMYCWFIDPHVSDIFRVTTIGCATMLSLRASLFRRYKLQTLNVPVMLCQLELRSNDKLTIHSWFSGTVPEIRLVFRNNLAPKVPPVFYFPHFIQVPC
jgi:hypothetical protein